MLTLVFLNTLQVVNAGSQVFFNAQMTEDMVQDLVRLGQPWVRKERSTSGSFPQTAQETWHATQAS